MRRDTFNQRAEVSLPEVINNLDDPTKLSDIQPEFKDDAVATEGNTSVAATYFNMFKCFVGIGILATPAAIKKVGIVGGAVSIFLCGCLNLYTMRMQIKCKEMIGP